MPRARDDSKPKGKFLQKPDEKSEAKKPWDKTAKKPKGKKRYKSNFSKTGPKDSRPNQPGSAPMKKSKPKKF
jgi:hypothetical protein